MNKKLYSIYYNDGEGEKHEVVASDHKPTNDEALKFISVWVEGWHEDGAPDYLTIVGVYDTVVQDFQTNEEHLDVQI